jgi:hypothetical protein
MRQDYLELLKGRTIDKIFEIFAQYFAPCNLHLPAQALESHAAGSVEGGGWSIQYLCGANERGRYGDFYACHRFMTDQHVRIYESGEVEALEAYRDGFVYPGDASPEQIDTARREYYEHNRAVGRELKRKGFG